MEKVVWKGGTMLGPVPAAMVTVSDGERDNIITVAWTGIVCSEPAKTYISVRPERFSFDMIKKSGEFAINLTSASLARAADYCGTHTGRKVDKFEKCSLARQKASAVSCPIIGESPVSLECRVSDVIELGSHYMFLADIVAVDVAEDLIGEDGRMHIQRAKLAAFAHGEYFELGRRIGKFGFSVKKNANRKKKPGERGGQSRER
ncbi:MAG: flavin reductase family protein [Clostridia bacterium]|nr:flavin reductase family protein [Clostridia bacterium]